MKYNLLILCILAVFMPKAQVVLQALDAPDAEFVVPAEWSAEALNGGTRWLVSVYDDNYYPTESFTRPESQPPTAQLGSKDGNNFKDPLLDYQGRIGGYQGGATMEYNLSDNFIARYALYPVELKFTKKVATAAPFELPQIVAKAAIPAQYIKGATQDETVYLKSYFGRGKMMITEDATVRLYLCADRDLNLVQLDMNLGLGQNTAGLSLTTFDISLANVEKKVFFGIRLVPAIPDRYAGKTTRSYAGGTTADEYEHEFFYFPTGYYAEFIGERKVVADTFLNYILGANVASLVNPYFAPFQVKEYGGLNELKLSTGMDHDFPYGSLYQWQRPSDGHELIKWDGPIYGGSTSDRIGTPKYGTTTAQSDNSNWTASHSEFILGNKGWTTDRVNALPYLNYWGEYGANDPCPVGYYAVSVDYLEPAEWPTSGFAYETVNHIYGGAFYRNSNGEVVQVRKNFRRMGNVAWVSSYEALYKSVVAMNGGLITTESLRFIHPVPSNYGISVRCIKNP